MMIMIMIMNRFSTPPPPRGGGVQGLLSRFVCSLGLRNHFQEVVVFGISLPVLRLRPHPERRKGRGVIEGVSERDNWGQH